jgi:hypothetical protein
MRPTAAALAIELEAALMDFLKSVAELKMESRRKAGFSAIAVNGLDTRALMEKSTTVI